MDDMWGIGSRLREERLRLGPNQTDFGASLDVGKNTQYAYEKGERAPDLLYLLKAKRMGVDIWYVMTGDRMPAAESTLTPDEHEVITYFRGMSEKSKDAARRVVFGLAAADGALDSGKA
ncbi:helix-turn-helix transcriptional regulator [Pseudomonas oryzihabitans]|uniref:helix-turn-helix domain-containing protein n=1 Tax=Pseudomonas oryzihabitans TaxID=47885 RepID=UPI0028939B56|nr:helix-turn-helix transcriptional regulator [Pseudomonas oryzihabitans]MDT3723195.1 helix-turn-helix transcriptional regulator [Pseudomonas oryzihabitans]